MGALKPLFRYLETPQGLAVGIAALVALLLLVFVLGRYLFPKVTGNAPTYRDHLLTSLDAITAMLTNNIDQAIERLVDLVRADTETIEGYFALGSLYREKGEYERALRVFQNLVLRPDLSDRMRGLTYTHLALTQERAGLIDEAQHSLEKVIAFFPKNLSAHRKLQHIYEERGAWQKAIDLQPTIIRLLRREGRQDEVELLSYLLVELGRNQMRLNQHEQALKSLKKARNLNPGSPFVLMALADTHILLKDYKRAIGLYAKAVEQDVSLDVLIYPKLRRLYEKRERLEQYVAYLKGRFEQQPDAVVGIQLGRELLISQSLEEAQRVIESVVALAPDNIEVRQLQATLVQALDDRIATAGFLKSFSATSCETPLTFHCRGCGHTAKTGFWRCPQCMSFDTAVRNPLRSSKSAPTQPC